LNVEIVLMELDRGGLYWAPFSLALDFSSRD